jgi:hypothetical protein
LTRAFSSMGFLLVPPISPLGVVLTGLYFNQFLTGGARSLGAELKSLTVDTNREHGRGVEIRHRAIDRVFPPPPPHGLVRSSAWAGVTPDLRRCGVAQGDLDEGLKASMWELEGNQKEPWAAAKALECRQVCVCVRMGKQRAKTDALQQ